MKRFVPREKLGKKARKQLDSEQRATWAFSPVTKKVESKKLYNRKRKSHDRYDDYGMGFLFYLILPRREFYIDIITPPIFKFSRINTSFFQADRQHISQYKL